jgi:hypothetical protein
MSEDDKRMSPEALENSHVKGRRIRRTCTTLRVSVLHQPHQLLGLLRGRAARTYDTSSSSSISSMIGLEGASTTSSITLSTLVVRGIEGVDVLLKDSGAGEATMRVLAGAGTVTVLVGRVSVWCSV